MPYDTVLPISLISLASEPLLLVTTNKAQKHIAANLQKTKNEKINKKAGAEK